MKVRDVSARTAEDAANDRRTLNYVSHLQQKLQVVAFATTSQAKKEQHKGVTIRETGVGEKRTPVFLSFTATLFRLRGLEILLRFF